jgi:hypothetical protein
MKIRDIVFPLAVGLCVPSVQARDGDCDGGTWARSGANVFSLANPDEFEVDGDLTSPDGRWTIRGRQHDVLLVHGSSNWTVPGLVLTKPFMELLWSPDSTQFAINESDGNAAGTWIPHLYAVDENYGPVRVDLKGSGATKDAASLPRCAAKEDANLAVVGWLAGRKQAMLVAEAPPRANCKNVGGLRGYRIDSRDGKLLETLPESRVRGEWRKWTGCRFESPSSPG